MSLRKNPIEFLIGTDSEFLMVDGNRLIIDNDKTGKASFGSDGTGYAKISEIRSKPFECPLKVVNNIREIFLKKVSEKPNYLKFKWVSRSNFRGKNLGTHIHYSVPKTVIRPEDAIHYLENYVGSLSVLLEEKNGGLKRRENYGWYGDFRTQFHGGFEQRSIGATLQSPHIIGAFLSLGRVVMYELVNNKSFKWNFYVGKDDFSYMKISDIRNKFPQIWKQITEMSLYSKYKKQIDFLKFLIDNKLTWHKKNSDIKAAWGIINTNTESKKEEKITTNDVWKMFKPIKINQQVEAYQNLFTDEPQDEVELYSN